MASVELRGLTKHSARRLPVVDDVSLTIEHGRLVCLLGPSGCGKTTTLRLIAGFVEPSRARSRSATSCCPRRQRTVPPERRNMSMIFQSYALWPHMTVGAQRRLRPEAAQGSTATRSRRSSSRNPRDDAARRTRRPLSGRAVRRPAAARGAGARADRRAGDAAARRAAVEPRRQAARGDALRGPPPARRVPLHHGLRDPRPVPRR